MAQIDDNDITIVSKTSQPNVTAISTRHCPKCGLKVADSTSVCPQDGTQIYEAQEELLAAKYEFMNVSGSGGMSVVYKARRHDNGEIVAIKMLHSLLMNDQALKRFQQEAKAITSLRHPNIITVHDFGVSEHGQPYMVMDFIDGNTLADVIKDKGGLTVEESLHRFIQLCDALEHAHEGGVLHRDLKPSNIMISNRDGNFADARIVDFGIAKLLDKEGESQDDGHLTRTGELFGSPLYMSPEQCRGSQVDARTDIYSMGCVMYETLTGQPPLRGSSMVETFVLQMTQVPTSMSEACPDKTFPDELETVIAKALAKDPDDRFQSMTELEYALMQIQPNQIGNHTKHSNKPTRAKSLPVLTKTSLIACSAALGGFTLAAFLIPPIMQNYQESRNKILSEQGAKPMATQTIPVQKIDLALIAARNRKIRKEMDGGDETLIEALKYGDLGLARVDLSQANPPITDNSGKLLGNLRSLVDLTLDDNHIGDETLHAIETLPIVQLSLRRTEVDDEGIRYLIHMKDHLEQLFLSGSKISGEALITIAKNLHALKQLSISELKFTKQSFKALKSLSLRHLHADQTNLDDDGVSALAEMNSLIDLQINYTAVGDRGISSLKKLSHLKDLGIAHTNITDGTIGSLQNFPELESLNIGATEITDNGVQQLSKLKKLHYVGLDLTKISDKATSYLVTLPKLDELNLANCKLTDAAIDGVSKLSKLKKLDLGGNDITDKGLAKLGALKKLEELTLYDCPHITIGGARRLQNINPHLHIKLLAAHTDEQGFYEDPRNFLSYPNT